MLCRITETFLASATRALPAPDRLAIACAQSFKLEALFNRVRTTPAASYIKVRASVRQSTRERIAALRYPYTAIDLTRLILSRRETKVRAYGSWSNKARWILNRADIYECGQHTDAGHTHEQPAREVRPHQRADRLVESDNLLTQLPPSDEHRPDNERDVGTIEKQCFNFSIKRQSPHRAW